MKQIQNDILRGLQFIVGMAVLCAPISVHAGENKENLDPVTVKPKKSLASTRPAGVVEGLVGVGGSWFLVDLNDRLFSVERNFKNLEKNLEQRGYALDLQAQKELLKTRPDKIAETEEQIAKIENQRAILRNQTKNEINFLDQKRVLTRNGVILVGSLLTLDGVVKILAPDLADGVFALDDVAAAAAGKVSDGYQKVFGHSLTPATTGLASETVQTTK